MKMSGSLVCFFVFFFKQKTAYEMRISDWSSDVCSSDLRADVVLVGVGEHQAGEALAPLHDEGGVGHLHVDPRQARIAEDDAEVDHQPGAVVAVEVEVHADLAGAAERHEVDILGTGLAA